MGKKHEHSPAPWEAEPFDADEQHLEAGDADSISEAIADGNCIAAAPDTLDVCRALLETVSAEGEVSRLSELSLSEVRELARVAVEKARPA